MAICKTNLSPWEPFAETILSFPSLKHNIPLRVGAGQTASHFDPDAGSKSPIDRPLFAFKGKRFRKNLGELGIQRAMKYGRDLRNLKEKTKHYSNHEPARVKGDSKQNSWKICRMLYVLEEREPSSSEKEKSTYLYVRWRPGGFGE